MPIFNIEKITTEAEVAKPRGRTPTQPPLLSLEKVVSVIKDAGRDGDSGQGALLGHVLGNKETSGSFAKKITAFRAYNVIDYHFTKPPTWDLTQVGKDIVHASSEPSEIIAIAIAFLQSEILRKIWLHYKGSIVRNDNYLWKFIADLDIPDEGDVRQKWCDYFIENGLYARLLTEREPGVYTVLASPQLGATGFINPLHDNPQQYKGSSVKQTPLDQLENMRPKETFTQSAEMESFEITLSGGKRIMAAFSKNLDDSEIELVKAALDSFLKSKLDTLRKRTDGV